MLTTGWERGIHTAVQQLPHSLRLGRGAQPVSHTSLPPILLCLFLRIHFERGLLIEELGTPWSAMFG